MLKRLNYSHNILSSQVSGSTLTTQLHNAEINISRASSTTSIQTTESQQLEMATHYLTHAHISPPPSYEELIFNHSIKRHPTAELHSLSLDLNHGTDYNSLISR